MRLSDMKTPNTVALVKEGIELDRHYSFLYCSPSRSSLMTGRLPFHAQQINYPNWDKSQGAPRNMTFIPRMLKQAGYRSVHIGKWHLGMSSVGHIPKGRGFDRSLAYFEGAEDHFTQRSCVDGECILPIPEGTPLPPNLPFNVTESPYDLWMDDHPADGRTGPDFKAGSRYNGYLFTDFAVQAIQEHDHTNEDSPLFMYLAAANSHTPLEAPQEFLDLYPDTWYQDRRQYAAMCSFWDAIVGNITSTIKAKKGMWENTLFVFSGDNGGPVYFSANTTLWNHGAGANNFPLKGGKVSNWEGGVRVASFVSGGFVPEAMRGKKLDGYVHLADWLATFAHIAGVDPTDHVAAAAGLPAIDSLNMWPYLSGETSDSPRDEIPLAIDFSLAGRVNRTIPPLLRPYIQNISALISGEYKLLYGLQVQSFWQAPVFPNASSAPYGVLGKHTHICAPACLYNVRDDPTEQHNLVLEHPLVVERLLKRVKELQKTHYFRKSDIDFPGCNEALVRNGNFFGPWLP